MIKHESTGYWTILDGNNSVGVPDNLFEAVQEKSADDKAKVAVYADTLAELAEKIGVDADDMKEIRARMSHVQRLIE